jgi:hypothetical protein
MARGRVAIEVIGAPINIIEEVQRSLQVALRRPETMKTRHVVANLFATLLSRDE